MIRLYLENNYRFYEDKPLTIPCNGEYLQCSTTNRDKVLTDYYLNDGFPHREDGPAIINPDRELYLTNGKWWFAFMPKINIVLDSSNMSTEKFNTMPSKLQKIYLSLKLKET